MKEHIEKNLALLSYRRQSLRGIIESSELELSLLAEKRDALAVVMHEVHKLATDCQNTCQATISNIVTRCLESIFGKGIYTFKMIFETKRNQTEVRFVLLDSEENEYHPLSACGGGIVDVLTFGLRLACLVLHKPQPAKLLILDEPFRFVSAVYRDAIGDLLEELSLEFGVQIIMVTHLPELATKGHVIHVLA